MSEQKPVKYLLVEDDPVQACLLEKWLKKVAKPTIIEVVIAHTLKEGLEASEREKPNATFLDLHLPDAKDWRVVADAIPQFRCRAVIVIAITGVPDLDHAIEFYCYGKGCANFFSKPFDDGFFSALRNDKRIFAADLIKSAGSAQLRAALGPAQDGPR